MAARSDAWFRRVGTVSLTTSGGSQVQGFGAVLPWREERADLWGERPHALGRLPGPLYQFVGSFPQLLEAIQMVAKTNVVGADVNELAPMLDQSGVSTAAACKVLRELLLALSQ